MRPKRIALWSNVVILRVLRNEICRGFMSEENIHTRLSNSFKEIQQGRGGNGLLERTS